MIFQPWNWYRESYSIVQSQTRYIMGPNKSFIKLVLWDQINHLKII